MTLIRAVLHSYDINDPIGNEFLNIFGYRSNLPVINEFEEFATAFETEIMPALTDVVSEDMQFTNLELFDMTDGVLYLNHIFDPVLTGQTPGVTLPRFVAWSYKYQRATIGKRSGGKRFGKLTESQQDDGVATPATLTALNTLASALGSPLHIALVETWFPEILERKPAGVYPWTSHPIAGVIYESISTQNTRKR